MARPETTCPLVPEPSVIDVLPADQLHVALAELVALQARIVARLAQANARPEQGPDRLLTVKQAAPILGMSVDWLYRNAGRLPFARRQGRRALRFSEHGVRRYIAERGAS